MNQPERTTMSKYEYYIFKEGCTDKIMMKDNKDETTCRETDDQKYIKSDVEEVNARKKRVT